MNQFCTFLLLLAIFITQNAFAQPGSNDPTFSPPNLVNGMGDGVSNLTWVTVIQPDGKILIASGANTTYNGIPINGIARLNPDGTLDTSFHTGTGLNAGYLRCMVLQPDGKIVLAGGGFSSYNGILALGVFRLNANGTMDQSFFSQSTPSYPGGNALNQGLIYTMQRQSDGKIIIGGYFTRINTATRNFIARLNANGTLDPSFGGPGQGTNDPVNSISVQSNDKIIVCGDFSVCNGYSRNGIARLNANGSIDNTFLSGSGASYIETSALLANDQIMIQGSFLSYNGTSIRGLARLNANGTLDNSFNPGTGVSGGYVYTISQQSDNKLILGGIYTTYNGTTANRIIRLNSDGTIDPGFDAGTGFNGTVYSSALVANGKIILVGDFTVFNGYLTSRIVRLDSNGHLDFTFNPSSGTNSTINASEILSDGKILIGGDFTGYNGIPYSKIARLKDDGVLDTSFHIGSGMNASVKTLAVQSDGKFLVGGDFTTYKGSSINRIARLTTNGDLDSSYNSFIGANKTIQTIVSQSDGKVVLGGDFTSYNGNSVNRIVRSNTNGSIDNSFSIGSGFDTTVTSISLQPDGKILVGGNFNSFNGSSANKLLRLTATGIPDPSFVIGAGPNGKVRDLKLQTDGKLLVGGDFTTYNGMAAAKILRLNSDGSMDGTFNSGSGFNAAVETINVQTDGKLLIGGDFTTYNGTPVNRLIRLNPDGSIDSVFETETGTNLSINAINIQSDGRIVISGAFTNYNGIPRNRIARLRVCEPETALENQAVCSSYHWNLTGQAYTTSGVYTHTVSGALANGCDSVYTLNLTIYPPSNLIQTVSNCVTYLWPQNGTVYTSSGQYTDTLTNIFGCDSIIVLNLTITHPNSGTDTQTACDSYDWIDGNTYTSSTNTPTFVLQNAAGCDSTVTLNLTITHSTTGTDVQTACDSYDWIDGNTYTSSTNTPTFVLQNAAGCDSTVTLNLTINHSTTGTDIQTACDSYDWIDGNTYTSSTNTPTFVLQNAAGCDSTVTLNLTINHSTTGTDVQTACDSYDWIDGNTYTSSTNTPTFVLQNAAGCDSTVTLNLTINHSTTGTDIQTACDSYDWIDGNTYTSSTNTPTFVLQNAAGCDSTVTLNLTINHSTTGTDVQTACDSYDWIDGNTYTSSTNTPTFVLQNAAGCDSTVTLNLTINHSTTGTDIQTACDSYDWIDGNTYTSSTNTPTFVLQNAAGCDSTVTLNLTITHSTTGTDVQTACDSYDWIDGNTYTSSTNTPTFVLQNVAGCDSTVTLNLTINHSTTGTDIQTACDSYDWIDGNTYTSSTNTPTFVLQNVAGCDSTVTLNLTINHSTTGTDIQTACDSYDWIDGNTYTSST
ncbi:delta-60 repeat domain-containing protein, partial [Fluviicola chungangensis]